MTEMISAWFLDSVYFWLYSFRVCFPFLGTSVIQVTASDADDPTYGNSAKLVYSILEGQPYFSVEAQTGIIEQFIWVGPHNWNAVKWRTQYIDWGGTAGYICWCGWAKGSFILSWFQPSSFADWSPGVW